MASVDANVLLRWALHDLPEQAAEASKLLEGGNEVEIADAAIIEMVYVLEKIYGLDRGLVAAYVRAVMTLGSVGCNRNLFTRVLPLYEMHQQLSLTDCCLAIYAEINGASPLYTFDKKLAAKLPMAKEL